MANFPRLVTESHAAITFARNLRDYVDLEGPRAAIGEAAGHNASRRTRFLIRGKSAGRPEAAGVFWCGEALGCVQPIKPLSRRR